MASGRVTEALSGKWGDGTRPKDLWALYISKEPEKYVGELLECLKSAEGKRRSGCSELVSFVSEAEPGLLYPHIGLFIDNLEAREPVIRWEAVCTLGNLASVDRDEKLPGLVPRIERHLNSDSIVLQNHAVHALAKIAHAYPSEAPRILDTLTGVTDRFPGNRVGFIVEVMELFDHPSVRARAEEFVEPYLSHEVKPVAAKAKKALKALRSD